MSVLNHLLDPLSADEVACANAAVLSHYNTADRAAALRFIECTLDEPSSPRDRARIVAGRRPWLGGGGVARRARVVVYAPATNITHVYIIDVRGVGEVLEVRSLRDVQPAMDGEEYELCEDIVKADPRLKAACERRGIDVAQVVADPWCPGYFGREDGPERRLSRPLLYVRERAEDNVYARPLEGIRIVVDLAQEKVIEFEDVRNIAVPDRDPRMNYPPASLERRDIRPIEITQPEGPSFKVSGHHVSWQRWAFRISFNAREGLVLHNLSYHDAEGDRVRSVAYRVSFAEMVVPYSDPSEPHYRKNAFDAGEDGLGRNAHSLERGCDCLGHIHYFDAHLSSMGGGVRTIRNAVCLHEEDAGILWKHMDWRTDATEVRRSRRLVVSFICTVANYEYGFFYYFYQDGTIEFDVKLTGILSTGALDSANGETARPHGTTLNPHGLYAPIHTHFFVARLDMAVDGLKNTVVECETVVDRRGEGNPYGNAASAKHTVLASERRAARTCDATAGRFWLIQSETTRNRTGAPCAWKLVPHANVLPFVQPDADIMARAGFLSQHLWVTRWSSEERYPGGDFPNQHPTGDGLHRWTTRDAPLVNEDVVLWHVFAAHHIPRLEDWPVMPVEHCGFSLKPCGFFNSSPCMDVPPSAKDATPSRAPPPCPRTGGPACRCERGSKL